MQHWSQLIPSGFSHDKKIGLAICIPGISGRKSVWSLGSVLPACERLSHVHFSWAMQHLELGKYEFWQLLQVKLNAEEKESWS